MIVWNTRLRKDKRLKLDKLKKDNPIQPPQPKEEEDGFKKDEKKG